ncbi:MAG: peroxiredoxin family protein [Akkermansiaceae bacterium]|nr:peroxiredoxin family protein [Armatimonadota bacterium]
MNRTNRFSIAMLASFIAMTIACARVDAAQPKVGDKASPVTWTALDGGKVSLSTLSNQGPVVLVVLRGFPGYQCPVCTMQVGGLISSAEQLAAANAQIVLVYPGPAEGLKSHATEFVSGKQIPRNFRIVLDPDFAFTKQYGLRWDAPGETAYPSTFVLKKGGNFVFAKISKSHGGRSTTPEILKALGQ